MCERLEALVDFRRGRESRSGYKPAGLALLHVRGTRIAPVVQSPFWACEAAVGQDPLAWGEYPHPGGTLPVPGS